MSLNSTPSGDRIHIGFFGRRNAGKSSVMNAVTGQNLAIVSEVRGTTTDPVYKAMELLPLGPVMLIDTPGLDDEGELGLLRVKKARQVLNKTDLAVVVADAGAGLGPEEEELIRVLQKKKIRYVIVYNKVDLLQGAGGAGEPAGAACLSERLSGTAVSAAPTTSAGPAASVTPSSPVTPNAPTISAAPNAPAAPDEGLCVGHSIFVSAKTGANIDGLKELIACQAAKEEPERPIVRDLLTPGDLVVLVIPVDKSAPKGRLILPQQQTIRDILDGDAVSVVVKENALAQTLEELGKKPRLVITDSQAFAQVSRVVAEEIPLTSFSILFARHKGDLDITASGASALERLKDGDRILIAEGCTHHRQCEDIGTVKLPRWIRDYTGKNLEFDFTSGTEFPEELEEYGMIVHCGGCMLNRREMQYRLACAEDQGIPVTNYGMLIAYMNGILERSMAPLRQN